jgi:hypothetical protein
MDKTCLYHYDPETKQLSVEWQHSGSPSSKYSGVQKCGEKFLASIFFNHPAHSLSSKGPNYQRGVLSSLLVQLNDILKEKCCGKVAKKVVFLHDNAPAHRAYLGFHCLDHPSYSPDLVPSDYHLFPGLKIQLTIRFFFRYRGHFCRGQLVGGQPYGF